jgi:UDP-N-acetylmuramate dehydrogenase
MQWKENASLKAYNTFGIDVKARYLTEVASVGQFKQMLDTPLWQNSPRLILGSGSNLLFTKNFQGIVVLNKLSGIEVVHETNEYVDLNVASGESWHGLVMHCIDKNWGGIENLSLIPGTVGAAPIQNIGAYGVEVCEVIKSVETIDMHNGVSRTFTNSECAFGYRESMFKTDEQKKNFISSVTLTLTKKNHRLITHYGAINSILAERHISSPTLRDISDAVISIRMSKLPDPRVIGNAGSFFKNPVITREHHQRLMKSFPTLPHYRAENQFVKIPAAWLIEQCGWKGKRVGEVGVHAAQALVLVNYGGGTGEEIVALAASIIASVKEKFDITLRAEVNALDERSLMQL